MGLITTKKKTHLLPGCFNNWFEGADDLVCDRVHEGRQYVVLFWCLILIRRVLERLNHRLNMEVDLHSLFGLHVT
jgi:hypothetical protein